MNKAILRAALGSASLLAWANPALAQDEPAQPGTTQPPVTTVEDDEDSILITAQRRAQLIQDVPISVSAFSGDSSTVCRSRTRRTSS
jgi:iron complex outermembrane recepter protein